MYPAPSPLLDQGIVPLGHSLSLSVSLFPSFSVLRHADAGMRCCAPGLMWTVSLLPQGMGDVSNPAGHMGPPFVMGLLEGRESLIGSS